MPTDTNTLIIYGVAALFVLVLILVGIRLLRGGKSKGSSGGPGFLRGRERRLGVVEAASVDGRRKLILLRRDDVEHLIMTGGPVDVVVETGIEKSSDDKSPPEVPRQPVFEKPKDDGEVVIARDNESAAQPDEKDS